jgi:NAD(P) transhydrogenase subunit alpha
MIIGVPKERWQGERRVALVPDGVARLVKAGAEVRVERGAGAAAFFPDEQYAAAGATLVDDGASAVRGADLTLVVRRPDAGLVAALPEGSTLVGLLQPGSDRGFFETLAARRVTALAMEFVPRITRAQSMDALSSQATIAGYRAVLLGAAELPRILPMLTTAAGTLSPAKVFIIGAGVAGLQAIATARRLGAVVSAFDVRPAVREQVRSLGATFVEAEAVGADAEGKGGYAKELGDEQQRRVLDAVGKHIRDMDLVITTAQIPGRPAPRLVTSEMVATMRPGSVVVDLAAETGGNCELTRAGERVTASSVTILGPVNLPADQPFHASQMYSRNLFTLVQHLTKDGAAAIDPADEITGAMAVTYGGELRQR